jgi:hypothetical protein
MIAVDENLCGIRLPALRRDIVCDVSTVRLVLVALGADLYAGSQYGVSTNNLSQLSVMKRNVDMSDATDQRLLEALLDSWDRNTILVNLLRALPKGRAGAFPAKLLPGEDHGGTGSRERDSMQPVFRSTRESDEALNFTGVRLLGFWGSVLG